MPAKGATTASSSPIMSTAIWRLCLFETILTDWESMMTTLGPVRLLVLARTYWRSSASSTSHTLHWHQRAKVL